MNPIINRNNSISSINFQPPHEGWNKKMAGAFIVAVVILTGLISGGITFAITTLAVAIIGASLGGATIGGAIAGYWAYRKVKQLQAEEDSVTPIHEFASAIFNPEGERKERDSGYFQEMDHNLAAQFLGGASIAGHTILAGQHLEGNFQSTIAKYLKHIFKRESSVSSLLSKEELSFVSSSLDQIMSAESLLDEKTATEFVDDISNYLTNMEADDSLLLPGGWTGSSNGESGHAMLYEFVRGQNDTFTMRVYNTGNGCQEHPWVFVNNKEKHMPYIEQKNIPLRDLKRAEVWRTYFKLQRVPQKTPYGSKNIYHGFLNSIVPDFVKKAHEAVTTIDPTVCITAQQAGTCSADSLLAFLRIKLGVKKYKALENIIQEHTLSSYHLFLQQMQRLGKELKVTGLQKMQIIESLGILSFLKTISQTFAARVAKLRKQGILSFERGSSAERLVHTIQKEIAEAQESYRKAYTKLSPLEGIQQKDSTSIQIPDLVVPSFSSQPSVVSDTIVPSIKWPASKELKQTLEGWVKTANDLQKKDPVRAVATQTYIYKIFAAMPSITSEEWDSVPASDRVSCIEQINVLTNLLHQTRQKNQGIALLPHQLYYVQKTLAVVKKLSEKLSKEYDPNGVGSLLIDSSSLCYADLLVPSVDPKSDQEMSEIASFFEKRSGHLFPPITVQSVTSSEINNYQQNMGERWQTNEVAFICNYLKANPKKEELIKQDLIQEKYCTAKDPPTPALIVAKALTDLEGRYLPKLYCGLKKQAHLVQFFSPKMMMHRQFASPQLKYEPSKKHLVYIDYGHCPTISPSWKSRWSAYSNLMWRVIDTRTARLTPNQIMIALSERQRHTAEICLLACSEERPQQIAKTISYFKEHIDMLQKVEYQNIFESLLFEQGLLKQQLKDSPDFINILVAFIQQGVKRAYNTNQPAQAVFFLRMGNYLQAYCQEVDEKMSSQFPDPLKEINSWLSQTSLSDAHRSLLIREYLAAFQRTGKQLDQKSCSDLLHKSFFLTEHSPPKKFDYTPHLMADIQALHQRIAYFMQQLSGEHVGTILSNAINPLSPPKLTWKGSLPVPQSSDGQYQIDLLTGSLYMQGYTSGSFPASLSSDPTFLLLFPNQAACQEIRCAGSSHVTFIDQFQRKNRAILTNGRWHFQKLIQKEWYDYYPKESLTSFLPSPLVTTTSCWQKGNSTDLLFLDNQTESIAYSYNYKEELLRCEKNDLRKELTLVSATRSRLPCAFFQLFDKAALFWKDSQRKLKVIELPTYGISLKIEYQQDGTPLIKPIPGEEGFYLAQDQLLPMLNKVPGYLILENSQKQRQVLIPRASFKPVTSLTSSLERSDEEMPQTGNLPYYTFQLNAKGTRLTSSSLEAKLYLAYLHLLQRNYQRADKILRKLISQLSPYSEKEIELLTLLSTSSVLTRDRDPRSCAIRLKAQSLLLQNRNHYHPLLHLDISIQDLTLYIKQPPLSPHYRLSEEEELALLEAAPSLNTICSRHLNFLKGESRLSTTPRKSKLEEPDVSYDKLLYTLQQGIVANRKLDDPLEQADLIFATPQTFASHFLSLYNVAKQPVSEEEKARLLCLLRTVVDPYVKPYADILQAVANRRGDFPEVSKITKDNVKNLFQPAKKEEWDYLVWQEELQKKTLSASLSSQPLLQEQASSSLSPFLSKDLPEEKEIGEKDYFTDSKEDLKDEKSMQEELFKRVATYKKMAITTVEKREIDRLGKEISYHLEKTPSSPIKTITKDNLKALQKQLQSAKNSGDARLKQLKSRLLTLANREPLDPTERQEHLLKLQSQQQRLLTMNDLELLCLRGESAGFTQLNPTLTKEDAQLLYKGTKEFLIHATKQQQIERSLKEIEPLDSLQDSTAFSDQVQTLYATLSAKREYDPDKQFIFLLFEYKANILMRKQQVDNTLKLLESSKSIVLQMIMGASKSDIIIPLIGLQAADGKNLSIIMAPEAHMESYSAKIQVRSGEFFNQVAHRIDWKRCTTPAELQKIYSRLQQITKERGFLLVTPNEIYDFLLKADEYRRYCCTQMTLSQEAEASLALFRMIKSFFKKQGHVLIDAVDSVASCRSESHLALGAEKSANPLYFEASEYLYNIILSDSTTYYDFSPTTSGSPFIPEGYQSDTLGKKVFEALLPRKRETDEKEASSSVSGLRSLIAACSKTQLEGIEKYLTAKKETTVVLPDSLPQELKDALKFLRGELTLVLPVTLNYTINEHYGMASNSPHPIIHQIIPGPFKGDKNPTLGDQHATVAEQINYTRQYYAKKGIPLTFFRKTIQSIQEAVKKELSLSSLTDPAKTVAYQQYMKLLGKSKASECPDLLRLDEETIAGLAKEVSSQPKLVQRYVTQQILPQIATYEERISKDTPMLLSTFRSIKGITETLTISDALPPDITTSPQQGIDGKILTLMETQQSKVISVSTKNPLTLFQQLITDSEKPCSLIDEGALFKDVDPLILAQTILDNRKEIKAVIYYEGNRPQILKRGLSAPLPYNKTNDLPSHELHQRFTLYDQTHCRSTDIPQHATALALVTLNKNEILAPSMLDLAKQQRVLFCLPEDCYTMLQTASNKKVPQVGDLLLWLGMRQAQQQAKDNLTALYQNLYNILFQKCDALLDQVPAADLNKPIFKDLNELLINKVKQESFDEKETLENKKVLTAHVEQMLAPFRAWKEKYKQDTLYTAQLNFKEIEEEMSTLIQLAVKGEKINEKIPQRNRETGTTIHISVQQQQVEQEQQQSISFSIHSKAPETPRERWLDPTKMFKSSYYTPTKWQGSKKATAETMEKEGSNPWLGMQSVLSLQREGSVIANLIGDDPLYISFDLPFTIRDAPPFGAIQRPLGPCLIVQDIKTKEFALYAITGKSAETFKKHLVEDKKQKVQKDREKRVCLYYPGLGIVQQGSDPISVTDLEKNQKFKELLVHYKFLCGKTFGYTDEELAYLKKWLGTQKDIKAIEQFFKSSLLRDSDAKATYTQSPLAQLFAKAT